MGSDKQGDLAWKQSPSPRIIQNRSVGESGDVSRQTKSKFQETEQNAVKNS